MVIPVTENYRITSDSLSWNIEKRRGMRNGLDRWEPCGFYIDFRAALVALAERRVREIPSAVPDEICKALAEIKESVVDTSAMFKRALE